MIEVQKLEPIIIHKDVLQIIELDLTLYDLSNIVNGDIQKIIDELQLAENTEKLKANSDVI